MDRNTLVIGGCRSGKSRWALTAAEKRSPARKCFIATCDPQDDEMKARVQRHRQERDPAWQAVESPLRLPQAIAMHRDRVDVILVDCLTVWLGNLMLSNPDPLALETGVADLESALRLPGCPLFLVSNEVGAGIVPENPLARRFRDAAGFLNQRIAGLCDKVVWMVAGIAVPVK